MPITAPTPLRKPLLPAGPAADGSVLRLVVQGFSAMERSLLDGTVRLSQRRTPRLELLAPAQHADADVVMIDTRDQAAMGWARTTTGVLRKPVIWVDGGQAAPGQTLARRPIQWSILPMLLARALEQQAAKRPAAGPAAAEPVLGAVPAARSRVAPILVVDDSQAVRAHMRSVLEKLGYCVEDAASAQAALELLPQRRYALVLMDVLMPELDGYEACKRIKAQQRTLGMVPIVMLTSRNSPFDRIRGKMSGCDGYLTKPAEPAALHEVLGRFAGNAVSRPAPPAPATAVVTASPLAASRGAPATRPLPLLTGVVPARR